MKKIINEFKTFIERGNVVDLAVGVVMGSAFSKIVTSVVDDLLMPIIGIIIGGHDFSNLSIKVGESTIRYGSLINNVINFFIIAFCIFLLVKFINKLTSINKKKEDKKEEGRYLRREFSYTRFQQAMILPDDVVKEKIQARMEHGVLTIDIPKQTVIPEEKNGRTIEIK